MGGSSGGGFSFDFERGISGAQEMMGGQWENVKKGDWGAVAGDMYSGHKYIHDPGGLFSQSSDPGISKMQQSADIGGYGARPAEEARVAEEAAKEQQAAIAKQEAEIEKKRVAQQAVIDERASRMAKNQLLSGKETGITSGSTSLLQG